MRPWFSGLKYFDIVLFGSSVILLLFGLLMIYSTTLGSPGMLLKQLIAALIGFVGMFGLAFYDYRNLKKLTGILYLAVIAGLVIVLVINHNIRGSLRWIDLGFFSIQPAEFAKLMMVIILAKYLDRQDEKLKAFRYVLLSVVYVLIPVALIILEPDLGSSIILLFIWAGMLLFSKIKKGQLAILIGVGAVAIVASWFLVLHDYQKQRIFTFLDPSLDPQGRGYNVIQSVTAVGSGSWFGRGVGRGLQSQLKFLPERQTDFIFASTAEELGLMGSTVILGLYFILLFRIVQACRRARDNLGLFLCLGILFMLFSQVVVNVGMNIGLLPVTGIPLPLLSFGGSSLLTTMLALGLVQSVIARQKALKFDS